MPAAARNVRPYSSWSRSAAGMVSVGRAPTLELILRTLGHKAFCIHGIDCTVSRRSYETILHCRCCLRPAFHRARNRCMWASTHVPRANFTLLILMQVASMPREKGAGPTGQLGRMHPNCGVFRVSSKSAFAGFFRDSFLFSYVISNFQYFRFFCHSSYIVSSRTMLMANLKSQLLRFWMLFTLVMLEQKLRFSFRFPCSSVLCPASVDSSQ